MTVYINGVAQSSGGAPTDADYLVGTAQGDLSAEIVAGAAPGGELGGTWAAPTVDATHSGSAHHAESHTHTTAAHGAASHDDRVTVRWPIYWSNVSLANAGTSNATWTLTGTRRDSLFHHQMLDSAANYDDIIFALVCAPTDMVTGTPTLDFSVVSNGTAGNIVASLMALIITDALVGTNAGTATISGAIAVAVAADTVELENLSVGISVAAGNWLRISLSREPLNASDTLAAAVRYMKGAALVYTADQ